MFFIVALGIFLGLRRVWPGTDAFGDELVARVLGNVPVIAFGAIICALYTIACLSFGLRLLRFLGFTADTDHCMSASAFLLGLGCLGTLWVYLALFGVFRPMLLYAVIALAILSGARHIKPAVIQAARSLKLGYAALLRLPLPYKVLAGIILLYFVPIFLLLPLREFYIDTLAYYAAQAKATANTGSLVPVGGTFGTYRSFLQLGLSMEMNYALCYALGPEGSGALALRFLVYPALLSILVLSYGIGAAIGIRGRWHWLVMTMVFTSTAVTFYVYGGKTDIFPAAAGLGAIYWMLKDRKSLRTQHCIVGGVLTGIAALFKFSYLLGFLPVTTSLLAWCLFEEWRNRSPISWYKLVSFVASVLITLILGWNLKNAVLIGEPLAPFLVFSDVFPFFMNHKYYPVESEWFLRLIFPFALFFGEFSNSQRHISPLLLAMAPFLLYAFKKALSEHEITMDLALLTACCLAPAAWIAFRTQFILPRLYLATCVGLVFPVVYAAQTYFNRHPGKAIEYSIVSLGIGLLVLAAIPLRATLIHQSVPFMAHAKEYGEYKHAHPCLRMAAYINNDDRRSKKVVSAGYMTEPLDGDVLSEMRYVFVNRTGPGGSGIPSGQTPSEFWRAMSKNGVDYIMVSMWTQGNKGKEYFTLNAIPHDVEVDTLEFSDGYLLYRFRREAQTSRE